MKKTSIITIVALVTSFGLVGCGGGSSSDDSSSGINGSSNSGNSSNSSLNTTSVYGKAIDPELVGATVCLDINQDGNCTENEPSATTDENGTYNLELSAEQLNGEYPLIAVNGIDKESGEAFKGKLIADVNSSYQNITPLTTLAYEKMQQDINKTITDMQLGMEKVEDILGMTYEEMQVNIITLANDGNTTTLKVALALQKSAEAIMPADTIQFYKDLAQQIDIAGQVDTLVTSILKITPQDLQSVISSLLETILNSNLTDAYALAEESRMKAIELGIDQEAMMEMMPEIPEMPETPEMPEAPDTPETPDMPNM